MNVKQYQKIKAISAFSLDDELTKKLKIKSELSGIPLEVLEGMELSELQKLSDKYNIEFKGGDKVKLYYKLGGMRIRFKWKLTDLTASQFISINHFINSKGDPEMVMHEILACLAYPCNIFGKSGKWSDKNHKEISEKILNYMDVEEAFKILSFFLSFMDQLEVATGNYLLEMTKKLLAESKKKLI